MDKKAKLTFMFSIITWLLVSTSTVLFSKIISGWHGLLVGLGVMFVSLIIHLIARSRNPQLYIISTCINALATGIAMSSYYACKDRVTTIHDWSGFTRLYPIILHNLYGCL